MPTFIQAGASGHDVGAVLVQTYGWMDNVSAYASRTVSKAQTYYTTMEKELLAVVFAIKKFCPYVFGHPCHLLAVRHQGSIGTTGR